MRKATAVSILPPVQQGLHLTAGNSTLNSASPSSVLSEAMALTPFSLSLRALKEPQGLPKLLSLMVPNKELGNAAERVTQMDTTRTPKF